MFGICDCFLACWRSSVNTACNSGYHESNSVNSFDPAQSANQIVAPDGEHSSASKAFQVLRQPARAKNTEREAAGTMRGLIHTILPTWTIPRTNRELNQLTADYSRLAHSLQKTHDELQQAKSELLQANGQLHRAHSEVRQLNDSVHHCQAELQASQSEVSRLQDKERSMRDFLIENNHNQIVSDRDVCERFTQLRQRIQRIASSKAYNIEEFQTITLDGTWFEHIYIAALWRVSSKSGRLAILRSLLFQLLHNNILDKLLFDINDEKASPYLAQLGNPFTTLGPPLGFFERVISDCAGKKTLKMSFKHPICSLS